MPGVTQVEVINPLTIVKVKDMDFASVAAAPSAGTVILNPATGVCSKTGVVILTGSCQAAVFDGLGSHLEVVRVQVSTSITLNGSKGGTMLLDTFTLDTAPDLQFLGGNGNGVGNGNRRYAIQPNSGLFTFRLGGTLHVAANQTPGAYSGTFSVTVRYQ